MDHDHKDHRQRMKNRFLTEGLDNFQDHEVLEFLLFFAIPRRDTNALAHRLINRFGSLRSVTEAGVKELMTVDGIGLYAATLIKFVSALSRRILVSEYGNKKARYTNLDSICNYLKALYIGCDTEKVYALLFNTRMELLDTVLVCEGSPSSVNFSPKKIFSAANDANASVVVLAHNHPGGLPIPSGSDIEMTAQLVSVFGCMSLELLEHIIVAGDKCAPIIKTHIGGGNEPLPYSKY